jgi:hypothetical protein
MSSAAATKVKPAQGNRVFLGYQQPDECVVRYHDGYDGVLVIRVDKRAERLQLTTDGATPIVVDSETEWLDLSDVINQLFQLLEEEQ